MSKSIDEPALNNSIDCRWAITVCLRLVRFFDICLLQLPKNAPPRQGECGSLYASAIYKHVTPIRARTIRYSFTFCCEPILPVIYAYLLRRTHCAVTHTPDVAFDHAIN